MWCKNMLGYFSVDIISRKTLSCKEQMMSKDKYADIFSPQMEAIVFIFLQIFFAMHAVLKIREYSRIWSCDVCRLMAHKWKYLMDYNCQYLVITKVSKLSTVQGFITVLRRRQTGFQNNFPPDGRTKWAKSPCIAPCYWKDLHILVLVGTFENDK